MTAIQTGDKDERTWQATPGNYEGTARLMEQRGFPDLAREWWSKAVAASGVPARAASCPDLWLGPQKSKCVLCDAEFNAAKIAWRAGTGNIRRPVVWLCPGCMVELRKKTTGHRTVKMRARSQKKPVMPALAAELAQSQ
jgi:hypothetical protein